MRSTIGVALLVAAASLAGCGGSPSGGNGGGGSCTPGATASITIRSSGITPTAVCVLPTGSLTFTNSDTAAHDIESGTCTDLNLGSIAAGASRVATFSTTETCPFHDAGSPSNTAFQGTVAVTTAPASGPGY